MGQIGGAERLVVASRHLIGLVRRLALSIAGMVRRAVLRGAAAEVAAGRSASPLGDRLATLFNVAPSIVSARSPAAVHHAVGHAVEVVLAAGRCHVVDLASDGDALVTTVPAEAPVSEATRTAVQRVLDTGAAVVMDGAEEADSGAPELSGADWVLCAPISAGGRVAACFYVTRRGGRPFEAPEIELACFIATLAGAALDHLANSAARLHVVEEEMRRRARYDALTGLPDRELFTDRVRESLARSATDAVDCVVLYLDVDDFKAVNESTSHAAGDVLLRSMADRLRASVRPGDTVARLSGDEFGVLLDDSGIADAELLAERIVAELARPFELPGGDRSVQVSVGIAAGRAGVDCAEELVSNADTAMLSAKKKGGGGADVFVSEMRLLARADSELRSDLGSALSNGELVVYYQPIIAVETGRTVCVEALLRWRHPRRGLMNPAEFIPLAEQSGQIVPIGSWVLRQACAQAVAWRRSFPAAARLEVSVNLAARQLQHPGLVADVAAALEESGLDPRLLTLEITESAMVEDTEATIRTLRELKRLGLRLSIDDFGTGYSALSYLRRFKVDVLKIDRSFVRGTEDSDEAAALVWAIASLARALHLEVVAEGVESMEQLEVLTAFGCDRAQGYNWTAPVPASELERWLDVPHDGGDHDRVRVLLVDDQEHMRGAVGVALGASERYCVVAEAGDGLAAREMAARHQPDLVLLDERMPGMSGTEALPGIVSAAPHATVVFLTADPCRRSAPAEGPVAAVIDKAYDLAHLVELLEPLTV